MHCTNCGHAYPDGATVCPQCGAPIRRLPPPGAVVPNYLVPAILVTLCCCVPFGVVSIVYAAQVNGKLAAGDVAAAQEASKKAKMWAWIAFGGGVMIAIVYALGALAEI